MNGTDENKVDSLIAELRSFGDRPPPRFAWKRIADELESAVKEEREELREAATAKMPEGATIIDNRGQGNAAEMRRALQSVISDVGDYVLDGLDVVWCGIKGESLRKAKKALSAPPRQCDVGTAEEQEARYHRTGEVYHSLTLKNTLSWSQTPYEKGESK